jgi:hypothetical protein
MIGIGTLFSVQNKKKHLLVGIGTLTHHNESY